MAVLAQVGLVAAGSAVGGLLRWGVGLAAARWLGAGFPWGTLVINVSGCLFLGWFQAVLSGRLLPQRLLGLGEDDLRLLVAVGFTGAYTTFSTFAYESDTLLRRGDGLAALTYLFASTFAGLVAARVGFLLAGG